VAKHLDCIRGTIFRSTIFYGRVRQYCENFSVDDIGVVAIWLSRGQKLAGVACLDLTTDVRQSMGCRDNTLQISTQCARVPKRMASRTF
jgi:hypothetical protein